VRNGAPLPAVGPVAREVDRVRGERETVEEMQVDVDSYLETYNRKRPHRGRGMEGRTPYAVFKTGLKDAKKAARENLNQEESAAA